MPSASWTANRWAWSTLPRWTIPLLMEHLANVRRNIIDPSPLTRAVQCVSTAFARWMLAKTQLNSTQLDYECTHTIVTDKGDTKTIPRSIYRYYRAAQLIIESHQLWTRYLLECKWMPKRSLYVLRVESKNNLNYNSSMWLFFIRVCKRIGAFCIPYKIECGSIGVY